MIDHEKLPPIFNARLYRDIQDAINEYDVLNLKLPVSAERRLLTVIEQMRKEYANNDKA